MFAFFKNYFLKQELKKNNSGKQFTDWASVKTICLVMPNESSGLNYAKSFIAESKKEVDIVVFSADKLTLNKDVYLSLNKKDINWKNLPENEQLQKLRTKTYDVVLCGDLNDSFILQSITLMIKAKCRVGAAKLTYSSEFDLSISGEVNDIGNFLKQALKYLSMIKAN